MKQLIFLFSILFLVTSCKSTKTVMKKEVPVKNKEVSISGLRPLYSKETDNKNSSQVKSILKDAEYYLGTPYQYGGNTVSGFDCSGFTTKVYDENNIRLPRRSLDQANTGKEVSVKDIKPGDLLFFATSGGTTVSHVGIAYQIGNEGEISFIHASTSKGVIVSSLNEKYWNKAFLFARRVL